MSNNIHIFAYKDLLDKIHDHDDVKKTAMAMKNFNRIKQS